MTIAGLYQSVDCEILHGKSLNTLEKERRLNFSRTDRFEVLAKFGVEHSEYEHRFQPTRRRAA
jgi:hypothetical protein